MFDSKRALGILPISGKTKVERFSILNIDAPVVLRRVIYPTDYQIALGRVVRLVTDKMAGGLKATSTMIAAVVLQDGSKTRGGKCLLVTNKMKGIGFNVSFRLRKGGSFPT